MLSHEMAIQLANNLDIVLSEMEKVMKYSSLGSFSKESAGIDIVKITMTVGRYGSLEYTLLDNDIKDILMNGYNGTILNILLYESSYYDVNHVFSDIRIEIPIEEFSDDVLYAHLEENKRRMDSDINSIR